MCYDRFATGQLQDNAITRGEKRNACGLVENYTSRRLCKFYSGAFTEWTAFVVTAGLLAFFALFYLLISVYQKLFNRVPSKWIVIFVAIVIGLSSLWLWLAGANIPFVGIIFDHQWMIYKTLCPPDGSGNCTSGGFSFPFPTPKGLFADFGAVPLIYVILALLALRIVKMRSNKRGNGITEMTIRPNENMQPKI